MKRSNGRSLGEAMGDLVDAFGLREKLDEQALISAWDTVAGPMIARHTMALRYRAGVLRVKVDSAPLRHELGFLKEGLAKLLNERLGREVVRTIALD
jgi:predicted nucleic acid-binding Zn ribbon protein